MSWSDVLQKLDSDLMAVPLLGGWKECWDLSFMLCDNTLSHPQTMRRQRTEVVVELRKVKGSGGFTVFCLWNIKQNDAWVFARVSNCFWPPSHRTKETSTFWKGEMCLLSTSLRTTMAMETSDRYDFTFLPYRSAQKGQLERTRSGSGNFGHLLSYLVTPVDVQELISASLFRKFGLISHHRRAGCVVPQLQ